MTTQTIQEKLEEKADRELGKILAAIQEYVIAELNKAKIDIYVDISLTERDHTPSHEKTITRRGDMFLNAFFQGVTNKNCEPYRNFCTEAFIAKVESVQDEIQEIRDSIGL